jgi:uncharacterized protein (TIGR00730 family)
MQQTPHPKPPTRKITEPSLLAGRDTRFTEFRRVIRIAWEFVRGFRTLHFIGPSVTVFGSARFKADHPHYDMARRLGAELARQGLTVMTGGGPGIMEAANRGAHETGGRSVGAGITLPQEVGINPYVHTSITFYYFFVRKVMLVKYSYAFFILPGGLGTLDEMMEALTLIQTKKLKRFPVILMGRDYWKGLIDWLRETQTNFSTLDLHDLDSLIITDDPKEAAEFAARAARDLGVSLEAIAEAKVATT